MILVMTLQQDAVVKQVTQTAMTDIGYLRLISTKVFRRSGRIGRCAFSDVLVVSSEQIIRRENLLGQ